MIPDSSLGSEESGLPFAHISRVLLIPVRKSSAKSDRFPHAQLLASFTGADLKRFVEDGKAIYAYDKATGAGLRPLTDYFLQVIEGVRENKARYAEAEAQAAMKKRASSTVPGLDHCYVTTIVEDQVS